MNERLIENWRIHSCKYKKKNNNSLSKLSSQIICHFQIFEQCAYYIISHNLLDSEQRRRRTKAQHVAIFPPARFSQLRVQCFFLALKKGSNNLASGSIFCSPSIFYWGHRQFLSTCSCSSTMYMCILYYTMYILSTSYILLRYVLQQLETGNPTIKKINQLSHGNINEDTRSSSTQYILPS